MENPKITFDNLPQAIGRLISKVDALERRLTNNPSKPEKELPELLETNEAAAFLKIAKQTLYSKVMRREIPHLKQGKKLLFERTALQTYLEAGRRQTAQEKEAADTVEAEVRFATAIGKKKR